MSQNLELPVSHANRVLQYRLNTDHMYHPCPNMDINIKDGQLDTLFPISVDITSFAEIQSNNSSFPILYQRKLKTLDEKRHKKPHLENTTNYFEQKRIIALSDSETSERIIPCAFGKKKPCGKPRLCHTCASLQHNENMLKWAPDYPKANWSQLTLSYDEYVGSGATSFNQWYLHLDAIGFALKHTCSTGLIPGAMWREELVIEAEVAEDIPRFIVKPHVHALVPLKSLEEETLSTIVRWMRGYRYGEYAREISMTPNLAQTSIAGFDEYRAKLRYQHKPFDLVTPYKSAANQGSRNQIFFARLNRQARDLVEAITEGLKGRTMVKSAGIMNSSCAVNIHAAAAV